MFTRKEKRQIKARSLLSAKGFIARTNQTASDRAKYRYGNMPSVQSKTQKVERLAALDHINPNNPVNRTKVSNYGT